MEAGYVVSALFFTSLLSFSFRRDNNQVCESILSCWRLSLPVIYEDASAVSLTIVYYVHTKLGIGRQRCWGREFDVRRDLGGMSEIQQQLAALSRQLGQLAFRAHGCKSSSCGCGHRIHLYQAVRRYRGIPCSLCSQLNVLTIPPLTGWMLK